VSVSIVVAVADNGVIGRNGGLPWHLPDDLAHFKRVTMGKPVLMGRRTFESIGRALPGRRNLVLAGAHTAQMAAAGVDWVPDYASALQLCDVSGELCVIGGAAVFAAAMPTATRVYLTRVHGTPPGDVHFPELAVEQWRERARVEHAADARHEYAMSFIVLERAAQPASAERP
jgi:dihydrofolate reductase